MIDKRKIMNAEDIRKVADRFKIDTSMTDAERKAAIAKVEKAAKGALRRLDGRG